MLLKPAAEHPDPVSFLVVGHSHVWSLRDADRKLAKRVAAGQESRPYVAEFITLSLKEFLPLEKPSLFNKGPFNRRTLDIITRSRADQVVSFIGGNVHNVLGLTNHPQPFDFVLPTEPDLPLDPAAEILPSGVVRTTLSRQLRFHLHLLETLQRLVAPRQVIHLESPPPVPGRDIVARPGVFAARIQKSGVAPDLLRYKLWRMHSAIVREACRDYGVTFLRAPADVQDARHMLKKNAQRNPTHGNGRYGMAVFRQLLRRARSSQSQGVR